MEILERFGIKKIPRDEEELKENGFGAVLRREFHHFVKLQTIVEETKMPLGGNGTYMMDGQSLVYCELMFEKQKALFNAAKTAQKIVEVGVSAGHSALIMLLANPHSKLYLFDICTLPWTRPCVAYLETAFPGRISLFVGDSQTTYPLFCEWHRGQQFDLMHIDGWHCPTFVALEIKCSLWISRPQKTVLVVDDIDCVRDACEPWEKQGIIKTLVTPKCAWRNQLFLVTGHESSPAQELNELGRRYGTDKANTHHDFCNIYDFYFSARRPTTHKILEIGVFFGASLKMWRDYFPNAIIHGLDHFTGVQGNGHVFSGARSYFESWKDGKEPRIMLHEVNQGNQVELEKFSSSQISGTFDFILDDGSHSMKDQQWALAYLFELVRPGGYFVIEDVHTSKTHGSYGLLPDESNSTLTMLLEYQRTGKWRSLYMTEAQLQFLNENTQDCFIHETNGGASITVMIRRRCLSPSSLPLFRPPKPIARGKAVVINFASASHAHLQVTHSKWLMTEWGADDVLSFTPGDVVDPGWWASQSTTLMQKGAPGFGYWSWKPKIIATVLNSCNAEFIFYMDCHAKLRELRTDVITQMNLPPPEPSVVSVSSSSSSSSSSSASASISAAVAEIKSVVAPTAPTVPAYIRAYTMPEYGPETTWTKRDCFVALGCDDQKEYTHSPQFAATVIVFRQDPKSHDFVKTWLQWACHDGGALIRDGPNLLGKPNYGGFFEHRRDQSLFSLLCKKNHISPSLSFAKLCHHHAF